MVEIHMILRRALDDAVRRGRILTNPARIAHATKRRPLSSNTSRVWNAHQLGIFLASTRQHRYHAAIWLTANTGMRRDEILGLRWGDIDRSLPHHTTPAVAYVSRPKAGPGNDHPDSEFRVRTDRIHTGRVSLRINGQMHHIGLGRTLDGTRVILLIDGNNIRVIHATTGEIIRALTINPDVRYHGTGKPTGAPKDPEKSDGPNPNEGSVRPGCLATSH